MIRERRSFSAEFKCEAAGLVLEQCYSVAESCRALDIAETALWRWIDQLETERGGQTPVSKALTPEQQKTQKIEARINRLERPQCQDSCRPP